MESLETKAQGGGQVAQPRKETHLCLNAQPPRSRTASQSQRGQEARESETHECVYSGVDSSSSGGSARRGVWRTQGVDTGVSVSGGTQRTGLSTFTHEQGSGHQVLDNSQETETQGLWGGVPQTCTAPCLQGEPREREDRQWRLSAPHPETGSRACLPPRAPGGGRASPGLPRTSSSDVMASRR